MDRPGASHPPPPPQALSGHQHRMLEVVLGCVEQGLSQRATAREVGVSNSAVSQLLKRLGLAWPVTPAQIERLLALPVTVPADRSSPHPHFNRAEPGALGGAALEDAHRASGVLAGAGGDGHLGADQHPEVLGRVIEAGRDHSIEAAGSVAAGDDPSVVGEGLEVAADRGLRELQDRAELRDRELVAVEEEQDPAPRHVGEDGEAVEDGGLGGGGHYIRVSGYNETPCALPGKGRSERAEAATAEGSDAGRDAMKRAGGCWGSWWRGVV